MEQLKEILEGRGGSLSDVSFVTRYIRTWPPTRSSSTGCRANTSATTGVELHVEVVRLGPTDPRLKFEMKRGRRCRISAPVMTQCREPVGAAQVPPAAAYCAR